MKELTVINKNGVLLTDSREVAEMIGKEHKHLMRDIRGYINVLSTSPNLDSSNFFIEDSYLDSKNETRPCYLLTKQGCEMVANKMTGEKGILFTAEYVKRFNIMEECIKEAVKENEYTLEDKIAKLLSVLPEAERGEYMLKLVDKFYPTGNSKPLKEAKPKSKSPIGLTLDKVVDILRQAYNEAFMAARSNYIVFNKEITYKYSSYNGIGKRELNKFLLENNLVKIEKSCSGITCTCSINKKKIKALYIKADIFNN